MIDDDLEIFDSTQIFEYFEHLKPDPALWPGDARDRARARLLELSIDEVFFPNVVQLFPKNRAQADDATIEAAALAVTQFYARLEGHLESTNGSFFCGNLSYADIALFPAQFMAEAAGVALPERCEALHAWRARMLARASAAPLHRAVDYLKNAGIVLPGFQRLAGAA